MTTQTLKEKLNNGEDILLIDVRGGDEFENGTKIPGAENIPMEITAAEISRRNIANDKKIILICRTGNRSGFVTQQLRELGYNAENLEGGMSAWTD